MAKTKKPPHDQREAFSPHDTHLLIERFDQSGQHWNSGWEARMVATMKKQADQLKAAKRRLTELGANASWIDVYEPGDKL